MKKLIFILLVVISFTFGLSIFSNELVAKESTSLEVSTDKQDGLVIITVEENGTTFIYIILDDIIISKMEEL